MIGGSFAAAKKGACSRKNQRQPGYEAMVVADSQAIPLGSYLCSASPAEVALVEATLA